VAELLISEGARLEHYKLQFESTEAFHVSTTQVLQASDSAFTSTSISAGGALARNSVTVTLDGEGAECTLNGLYYTTGTQHVDNHVFVDHAKPRTISNQLFKGILDGTSRAVFGGRVLVRRDAQKVEAHQQDRNLVLSQGAEVDSKPQLEILADDVKCTHGATAGQLSDNDLFYLQTRGIDQAQARHLLAHAFAAELLDRVALRPVRKRVEDFLLRSLPSLQTSL
ncbi:MAG: sufD, partial [Dehalococcoidia bacterium]|nr:sufD [Dehalococcoidia bacterium]